MAKSISLLIVLLVALISANSIQAVEQKSYAMPGTSVILIKDFKADKQYELYIKLPAKYDEETDKKYPVIYFTDAVWHIELLSSATYFLMEDAILVGISWQKDGNKALIKEKGEYVSRYSDYSIKKSSKPEIQAKYNFGNAKQHLRFIREDVFRYVENNYRTNAKERTYFGFSLGGLFGTYIFLTQPDAFKNYILGSPSIWEDGEFLLSNVSKLLNSKKAPARVLITYGEKEKELGVHLEKFISQLKSKNYTGVSSLERSIVPNAGHSDSFPVVGVESVKWLSKVIKNKN